jgi:hypothetical protein
VARARRLITGDRDVDEDADTDAECPKATGELEQETGLEPARSSLEGRDVSALWRRAWGHERNVSSHRVFPRGAGSCSLWVTMSVVVLSAARR